MHEQIGSIIHLSLTQCGIRLTRRAADNNVNFYTIDATSLATKKIGNAKVKNTVLQSAFFSLANILDKAEEILNGVELLDPSVFEVDAKDYHESTEKEWKAWKEETEKA